MITARHYIILGAVLLLVPAAADAVAKLRDPTSSLGLGILLYRPFNFAYAVLAILAFAALGWNEARQKANSPSLGALAGAAIGLAWFVLAFLAIAQLHLSLGGTL